MAARRCSTCGINYPAGPFGGVVKCQVDMSHSLDYITNADPDPDWKKEVDRRKRELAAAAKMPDAIPQAKTAVDIVVEGGRCFVSGGDLFRAGVEFHHWTDSFRLFIANGRVWETQGWDDRRRRWWIEEVAGAVFFPEDE